MSTVADVSAETAAREATAKQNRQAYDKQMESLLENMKTDRKYIPCIKQYIPSGEPYWVCSKKPLDCSDSWKWLDDEFKHCNKPWSGRPDIKSIESRGLIDRLLTNPNVPKGVVWS